MWTLLLLSTIYAFPQENSFPDADLDDKTILFNDDLVKKIEEDIAHWTNDGRVDEMRHKIGTLAVYFHLLKELMPMEPVTGFRHVYPQNGLDFHSGLARNCSQGMESCLNYITSYLNKAHPWLTGESQNETEITRERAEMLINDNAVSLELSATQVLCWMTMRRIQIFEYIPFCAYRISKLNSSQTEQIVWPGKLFNEYLDHLDEFQGDAFECARKSFCPDPCCHDLDPVGLEFTEKECLSNTCKEPRRCYLQSRLNDDLIGQRENRWNVSCPCEAGMFFRSDVAQCVHENICAKEELCSETEECLNILGGNGYKCVCQLGYIRENTNCVKYGVSQVEWSGPGLTVISSSPPMNWINWLSMIIFMW